jgi:hypothetical protein
LHFAVWRAAGATGRRDRARGLPQAGSQTWFPILGKSTASHTTCSSEPLTGPDTSTFGSFMRELIAAKPLIIFIPGIKAAFQQQQR